MIDISNHPLLYDNTTNFKRPTRRFIRSVSWSFSGLEVFLLPHHSFKQSHDHSYCSFHTRMMPAAAETPGPTPSVVSHFSAVDCSISLVHG